MKTFNLTDEQAATAFRNVKFTYSVLSKDEPSSLDRAIAAQLNTTPERELEVMRELMDLLA